MCSALMLMMSKALCRVCDQSQAERDCNIMCDGIGVSGLEADWRFPSTSPL
jgi:hypothetical protein